MSSIKAKQTVIITGASKGVGKACARLFAQKRMNLVLIARNKKNLAILSEELNLLTEVMIVPMDVGNQSHCSALVEKVFSKFGSIDILINNAGYHARGLVENNKFEDLAMMIDINLKAPIVLSRLVLPFMVNKNCAIINVASLAGRTPVPGSSVYSASKFGLRAFTYSLAAELRGRDIKIAVISPGPIDTGFILDDIDSVSDLTFSQRISTVKNVAKEISNLCNNKRIEKTMPWLSGILTNLTYLFPKISQFMLPFMENQGRRNKRKIKNKI